jgi:hypothetical protein
MDRFSVLIWRNKMYATVSGIYENGQVFLKETAPTQNRMNVLIVFMDDSNQATPENLRADKLAQLQASQHDPLFMSDLQTVNDDFIQIDKVEMIDALSFELDL